MIVRLLWLGFAVVAAAAAAGQESWTSLTKRGEDLERAGNYYEAVAVYAEALQSAERSGSGVRRLVWSLNSLAIAQEAAGKWVDAEHNFQRALRIQEDAGGKNQVDYALLLGNIASLLVHEGRIAAAEPKVREALSIYANTLPSDDARLAVARDSLGALLTKEKKYEEAAECLNASIRVLETHPHDHPERLAIALNNLGVARRLQGRVEEAASLLEQSIAIIDGELSPDHPFLVRALENLALANVNRGQLEAAEGQLKRALAIAEKRPGTDEQAYGETLFAYSLLMRKMGNKNEAKSVEAHSKTVLAEAGRRNGVGMTVDASAFVH